MHKSPIPSLTRILSKHEIRRRWKYSCVRCGGDGLAWRENYSARAKKWWVDGVLYNVMRDAAENLGIHPSTIGRWCKGKNDEPKKNNCWYGFPAV